MVRATRDPATQSNPEHAAATHASLVLDIDFDSRVMRGSVTYTVEIKVSSPVAPALCSSSRSRASSCPEPEVWADSRREKSASKPSFAAPATFGNSRPPGAGDSGLPRESGASQT